MTGVIGLFVVVACAATLHVQGITIKAATRPRALKPLAGHLASTLFGLGFLGAALLAAAIVPLSTAYSVAESAGAHCDINDSFRGGAAFLLQLWSRTYRCRSACAHPRSSADSDLLCLSGTERCNRRWSCCRSCAALPATRRSWGKTLWGRQIEVLTAAVFCLVAASVIALAVLSAFSDRIHRPHRSGSPDAGADRSGDRDRAGDRARRHTVFFLGKRAAILRPALLGLAAGAMTVASISGLLLPGLDQGSAVIVIGGGVIGMLFLLIARQRLERRSDLGGKAMDGQRGSRVVARLRGPLRSQSARGLSRSALHTLRTPQG